MTIVVVDKAEFEHYRCPKPKPMPIGTKGSVVRDGPPYARQVRRYKRSQPEFEPVPYGGLTVATLILLPGGYVTGRAICSLSDNFSYETGRRLALQRAIANLPEGTKVDARFYKMAGLEVPESVL